MNLTSIWITDNFVMPYYFRLHLLSSGAAWLEIPTLCPLLLAHIFLKSIASEWSYYTNILLWLLSNTCCGSISMLAHFTYKQFHKAVPWYRNACYAQRSWLTSEKHKRKRLFLRTKDEQLSWALCLTEYGSSLYAKLEHYTNLHGRLRLYFVQSAFFFNFFSFLI